MKSTKTLTDREVSWSNFISLEKFDVMLVRKNSRYGICLVFHFFSGSAHSFSSGGLDCEKPCLGSRGLGHLVGS